MRALLDLFSAYQSSIFWGALCIVIALRLLSMWAFEPVVQERFPLIRLFNPNNWILFRMLSFPAALVLAVVGLKTGSYGHSLSNGFYGLVALCPQIVQRAGRVFSATSDTKVLFKVFGVPTTVIACVTYVVLSGEASGLRIGYALQAGGGFLLCAGFAAMMARTWGDDSAGSWSFLCLATAWDLLLLLGVSALYLAGQPVLEFVIFELVILMIELVRIVSKEKK